jgi:hypothetical protein
MYESSVKLLESTTLADLVRRVEYATREGPPVLRYSI